MELRFDGEFGIRVAGWLALEAGMLVATGTCIARWSSDPLVQRAAWRSMVLGLIAMFLIEALGIESPQTNQRALPPSLQLIEAVEIPRPSIASASLPSHGSRPSAHVVVSVADTRAAEVKSGAQTVSQEVWWPLWIWLLGTVCATGRIILGHLLLTLRLRRCEPIPPGHLLDRIETMRIACRVPTPPRCKFSHHLHGPMVFGLWRGTLVLPRDFEKTFSPTQQVAILAHEFAHVRSRDAWWRLLADLAVALWWWHPGAWWVRCQWRLSSEMAADGTVVHLKEGPTALAESLVTLGRSMATKLGSRGVGMLGYGARSDLSKRVHRLIELQHQPGMNFAPGHGDAIASVLACVSALGILLGPWPWVTARAERPHMAALAQASLSPGEATPPIGVPSSEQDLRDARRLLERGELLAANALLRNIITAQPENAVAQQWLRRLELLHCPPLQAPRTSEALRLESVSENKGRSLQVQLESISIPSFPPNGFETLAHALRRLLGTIVLSDTKDETLVGLHFYTATTSSVSSTLVRPWIEDPGPATVPKVLERILAEVVSGRHHRCKTEDWGILIMTSPDSTPWQSRKWIPRANTSLDLPFPTGFTGPSEITRTMVQSNETTEPIFDRHMELDASRLQFVRAGLNIQPSSSLRSLKLRSTLLPQIRHLMEEGEPEMARFLLEGVLRIAPNEREALRLKQELESASHSSRFEVPTMWSGDGLRITVPSTQQTGPPTENLLAETTGMSLVPPRVSLGPYGKHSTYVGLRVEDGDRVREKLSGTNQPAPATTGSPRKN